MKQSDFLFDLVHSLDKHEVKYIKERARSHRRQPEKVLALFRDLKSASEYKRQRLRVKYRNLDVLRFRLKQLILESLRFLHAEESPENLIRRHLENEWLLNQRGLYGEAAKELQKARHLAETYHLLGLQIEAERRGQKRRIETTTRDLPAAVEASVARLYQLEAQLHAELEAGAHYHRRFAAFRTKEAPPPAPEPSPAPASMPPTEPAPLPSFSTVLYRHLADCFAARKTGDRTAARDALAKSSLTQKSPKKAAPRLAPAGHGLPV